MIEIFIKVNIVIYSFYFCLCIWFTFSLVVLFCEVLFTCLTFYFMLVFVFSRTIICKQVSIMHCFVFVAFVNNVCLPKCISTKFACSSTAEYKLCTYSYSQKYFAFLKYINFKEKILREGIILKYFSYILINITRGIQK